MQRLTTPERRARLAVRHRLAPSHAADEVVEAAAATVGLHASDPASVFLAARARTRGLEPAGLERVLYDERSLLRILGMRRTMFVAPVELAAIIGAACTPAIAAGERRRTLKLLADAGIAADPEAWLAEVEAATVEALHRRGEATAVELTKDVPGLREQIAFGEGKRWAGTVGVSTRLLFLLAAEGRIVRGRPRGSWISSQYRWAPIDDWVRNGRAEAPSAWTADRPVEAARAELVRRWLAAFGPGTEADLRWWTGWPLRDLRRAIAATGAVEVELDGSVIGLCLPDDLDPDEPAAPAAPWVALLPGLDPTVMGWQARDWYLGPHAAALFDRNGNAGPTVWADGRIVGGWVQRPDGEIAWRLLEDAGRETAAAVEAEAARLTEWLGPVRFSVRFPAPLDRELLR